MSNDYGKVAVQGDVSGDGDTASVRRDVINNADKESTQGDATDISAEYY